MSKSLYFYAAENDKTMIAEILREEFGQLIDVTEYNTPHAPFNEHSDRRKYYLTEEGNESELIYRAGNGTGEERNKTLDDVESPVLEYTPSFKSPDGIFWDGRFYCRSKDAVFSKRVSKFFSKFKKVFLYAKKYKVYISPNIDLSTTKFGSYEETITADDLS